MGLPDAVDSPAGHLPGHLKELRDRLLISFAVIAVASGIAYFFAEQIADFFMGPLFIAYPSLGHLVYTNLTDAFIGYIKIAILVGLAASFPVCIYQAWMYVAPGLRKNEKNIALRVVFFGSSLFVSGVLFSFYVVLPKALAFFLHFASQNLIPLPRFGGYLTFVARTCFAFGLAFEIPFLMVMAGKSGLVSSRYFSSKRIYYYGIIVFLAFLLTAGDIFSAALLALPLFLLYETGVAVMRLY